MGKKTISLNLDDMGAEDDLISSILSPDESKNKNTTKYKKSTKEDKTKEELKVEKPKKPNKPKKTITLYLGEDIKSEIKLSDIEIEKPIKPISKKKPKTGKDPFIDGMETSKMSKVSKLDDFLNISKDENANSLTHPKTKDYQVGKEEADIKLQNIQTQISKINNKISKKGRNNVDTKYLDSLNKLLKKEKKYITILNSFSKNNNNPKHYLPTPDVNIISPNTINNIQKDKYSEQFSIKKIDNSPPKKNKHLTPKTNNIVTEIDEEMARVNTLLDLTEGKNGKYKGMKQFIDYDTQFQNRKEILRGQNSSTEKESFKNVNLQMNLDGVDYLPNMDINQLKKEGIKGKNKGKDNITKKEPTPPKTMFSVKANLLALKEREKMLARQKKKIQEKLEFKKKQILKAKQQEKEMRKIKALEEEKRRLFELDREVKRLDKLRYQQSLEMKNTMKQMTQKEILTQQNIDNIQKEDLHNKQQKRIQLGNNGYPIYQPYTYNFNLQDKYHINNKHDKQNRSKSPTLFTKLHHNMLNMGIGEQVLFKSPLINENKSNTNQSFDKKNNTNTSIISNKRYKYTRKDYIDSQNTWQDWKISHLQYFKDINTNTNIFVYPYDFYIRYLNNCIICKNNNFGNTNINCNKAGNNETGNNESNKLLNIYKRDIYQKIPLEDRKTELCQYLGINNKHHLDTILEKGLNKILPINKEKSNINLLKIWYSCFEEGKLFISKGNNKLFSQKGEKVETVMVP